MNKFSKITNIVLIVLLLTIAGASIYFYTHDFSPKEQNNNRNDQGSNSDGTDDNKDTPDDAIPLYPTHKYDETPAKPSATYFEKTPVIQGQQAYLAYPLTIRTDVPPRLIIYNHGSNTTVTTNFNDQMMKDLRYYGEFFTSHGFAFAASNQHGANNGNQASINDNVNLINWVKGKYQIKDKVDLLGFSMGGRPTIYFTQQNSSKVNAIAMLAPATCDCSSSLYNSLRGIPIKIWHGTADVNVPYSAALEFINNGKPYNLDITLRTIKGVGHFDIDTEYIGEIYEFFNAHEPKTL